MRRVFQTIESHPYGVVSWAASSGRGSRILGLHKPRDLMRMPLESWQCVTTASLINTLVTTIKMGEGRYLCGKPLDGDEARTTPNSFVVGQIQHGELRLPCHVFVWTPNDRAPYDDGWLLHSWGGRFGPRLVRATLREVTDHRFFDVLDTSPIHLEQFWRSNDLDFEIYLEWAARLEHCLYNPSLKLHFFHLDQG